MNEAINNVVGNVAEETVAMAMPKAAGSGNLMAFAAGVFATLTVEGLIAIGKKAYRKTKAKKAETKAEPEKVESEENGNSEEEAK